MCMVLPCVYVLISVRGEWVAIHIYCMYFPIMGSSSPPVGSAIGVSDGSSPVAIGSVTTGSYCTKLVEDVSGTTTGTCCGGADLIVAVRRV